MELEKKCRNHGGTSYYELPPTPEHNFPTNRTCTSRYEIDREKAFGELLKNLDVEQLEHICDDCLFVCKNCGNPDVVVCTERQINFDEEEEFDYRCNNCEIEIDRVTVLAHFHRLK